MASVISFEPDPPQVSSPWSTPRTSTPRLGPRASSSPGPIPFGPASIGKNDVDSDIVVTSLEAEPQDGPTEYKLHLLLRPRRQFTYSSTSTQISGPAKSSVIMPRVVAEGRLQPIMYQAGSNISRQQRLEQLTTQLLWRLQQSSSYQEATYSTSHSHLAMKGLFDDDNQDSAIISFPGLEDSKGALYEIGVADDGTFVGLAEDELDESLETLRQMAARLGCNVSIVRKVVVGECQWLEPIPNSQEERLTKGLLWVAEAYVRPNFSFNVRHNESSAARSKLEQPHSGDGLQDVSQSHSTQQLRVTLTGATASGKTSLLGILTTNILDDGRGKSRLNLLRHQHEQLTGLTSSVTHELLGYRETRDGAGSVQVVNFMPEKDICSWVDIHAKSEGGRLAFFSDSAGHPRFRRTTVRGLLGWNPHWTLLCLPADNHEDTSGRPGSTPPAHETLGPQATDIDLSEGHLNLCLQLGLPLVVVITKQDLASRTGLKSYLNKVLSILKLFGRQPVLITETGKPVVGSESPVLSESDLADLSKRLPGLTDDSERIVPIVLTSAVTGAGIRTLHALLYKLPIPLAYALDKSPVGDAERPLFDVEDIYRGKSQTASDGRMIILSGLARRGRISIGDELLVGPFHGDHSNENPLKVEVRQLMPGFKSLSGVSPPLTKSVTRNSSESEWCQVVVCSVRHLRLPARTLFSDQVGTLGVMPLVSGQDIQLANVRKGMVVTSGEPQARRTFTAKFIRADVDNLTIGSTVVIYFNSVRASARIIAGSIITELDDSQNDQPSEDEGFAFQFDSDDGQQETQDAAEKEQLVTFQFIATKEYVGVGSKVLVMPGGGFGVFRGSNRGEKGVAGLSGFVGLVVDGVDVHSLAK